MRTRSGRLFGAGPGAGDADDLRGESGVGDTLRTTADQTVKMQEARTQLEQEIARMEETQRRHAEALRRLEESQARRERLSRLLAEPAVTPASVRASDRPVREVSWGGADPLCTAAPQHGPVRHRWSARVSAGWTPRHRRRLSATYSLACLQNRLLRSAYQTELTSLRSRTEPPLRSSTEPPAPVAYATASDTRRSAAGFSRNRMRRSRTQPHLNRI